MRVQRFSGGGGGGEGEVVVMHNHDAGSEACLNRQILNNSVKGKQWRTCVKNAQTDTQRTTKPELGYCHLQSHKEH